jgi:hypothetical protein
MTLGLLFYGKKRLRVFENRVMRDYLDLIGKKWWEVGENCITSPNIINVNKSRRL